MHKIVKLGSLIIILAFCTSIFAYTPNKYDLDFCAVDSIYNREGKAIDVQQQKENAHSLIAIRHNSKRLKLNAYSVFEIQNTPHQYVPGYLLAISGDYSSGNIMSFSIESNFYNLLKGTDKQAGYDIEKERYYSGHEHISNFSDYDFYLPSAYLMLNFEKVSLFTGKKKVRWGPGFKSVLAKSNAVFSPLYFYYFTLPIVKYFKFSNYFCGLDDLPSSDTSRYQSGQRLEIAFGDKLRLGLVEYVNFNGNKDISRYAIPFQLYYVGSNIGNTGRENLLGGGDIELLLHKLRLYAEFINDDITIFDDAGNPNKYAYQVGGDTL
ncbi:MAG: hypothetical protein GF398_10730 [Chitinivibrionales bacterium]|nr:hypothetical protein [Chitinivibrionales bacterium]